jgi:hypothetical protein
MASSNIFDGKMQKKVDSKQKTWYSNCNSVDAVCLRETGALLFCQVSRCLGSVPPASVGEAGRITVFPLIICEAGAKQLIIFG